MRRNVKDHNIYRWAAKPDWRGFRDPPGDDRESEIQGRLKRMTQHFRPSSGNWRQRVEAAAICLSILDSMARSRTVVSDPEWRSCLRKPGGLSNDLEFHFLGHLQADLGNRANQVRRPAIDIVVLTLRRMRRILSRRLFGIHFNGVQDGVGKLPRYRMDSRSGRPAIPGWHQ